MVQAMLFDEVEMEVRKRISDVWAALPYPSPDYEILSCLVGGGAWGSDKAISVDLIIQSMEHPLGERTVRGIVKELVEVRGLPIGSSCNPARNGFYFVISDEDADLATRHIRNQIYSLFARVKMLSPKSKFVRELQGQIQLMMEEEKAADDPS